MANTQRLKIILESLNNQVEKEFPLLKEAIFAGGMGGGFKKEGIFAAKNDHIVEPSLEESSFADKVAQNIKMKQAGHTGMKHDPMRPTSEADTDGWISVAGIKPNALEVQTTESFGHKDKLILKFDGKKVAQFYYNMRGYNADFYQKNAEGVQWGFGGDRSASYQIKNFKDGLKAGYTLVKFF